MSAEAVGIARTFRVGRYVCTISIPQLRPGDVRLGIVEWDPPLNAVLTRDEARQYLAGRDAAVDELATEICMVLTSIDIDGTRDLAGR